MFVTGEVETAVCRRENIASVPACQGVDEMRNDNDSMSVSRNASEARSARFA